MERIVVDLENQAVSIVSVTQDEADAIDNFRLTDEYRAAQAATVRSERNMLLTASDWTQLADSPVYKTAWAIYRQELRDISTQDGFPTAVVWPVKP